MLDERLYEVELRNVEHFGYGVKGFVLSMIETAIELTGGRIDGADIRKIIDWGRQMLLSGGAARRRAGRARRARRPVSADPADEGRPAPPGVEARALGPLFKGIEIVSEKDAQVYRTVMQRYAVPGERMRRYTLRVGSRRPPHSMAFSSSSRNA